MNNHTNHSRAFLARCHARAKEIKITNTTLYEMVGKGYIHETTFYRIWNNQQPEPRIELEIALRLCSALGLSVNDTVESPAVTETPAIITPLIKEAHEEVARNTGEILSKRREEIERLQDECDRLTALLEEKENELKEMQREHTKRVDQLCDDLRLSQKMLSESYQHQFADHDSHLANFETFLSNLLDIIKNK